MRSWIRVLMRRLPCRGVLKRAPETPPASLFSLAALYPPSALVPPSDQDTGSTDAEDENRAPILAQLESGNVPRFLRQLRRVELESATAGGPGVTIFMSRRPRGRPMETYVPLCQGALG